MIAQLIAILAAFFHWLGRVVTGIADHADHADLEAEERHEREDVWS